jgi:hypothetical protein
MVSRKKLFKSTGLILLLIALIVFLLMKRNNNLSKTDDIPPNFALQNVNQVSRIFMIDKAGNFTDLKKDDQGNWQFNDSFNAWPSRVKLLLNETMAKLSVRSPVASAAKNNVLSRMAISAVKVMVYGESSTEPSQVYYVGGTTPDLTGTYFLQEGGQVPQVVHIPGFNGYLNTRFSLNRDEWISRTVFGSTKEEIIEAGVTYPNSNESFKLIQKEGEIEVEMDEGLSTNLNRGAVRSYLNLFEQLNFEGYDDFTGSKGYIDTLKQTQPLAVITIKSKNRGVDQLSFYIKPVGIRTKQLYDKKGNELSTETDRYYALYNKADRLLIVQDYTFKKVLVRYSDLLMRNK